jgi:hypothetical protein
MLEYAWDVSPKNYLKCDPCVATAPSTQDLVQSGVWWLSRDWNNYNDVDNDNEDYSEHVFFTRLHVRYNRSSFPQDLMFEETANNENFQARYVITHPATGDLNCDQGKKYLKELKQRRKEELETLTWLTGRGYNDWDMLVKADEEKSIPAEEAYAMIASDSKKQKKDKGILFATLGVMGLLSLAGLQQRKKVNRDNIT